VGVSLSGRMKKKRCKGTSALQLYILRQPTQTALMMKTAIGRLDLAHFWRGLNGQLGGRQGQCLCPFSRVCLLTHWEARHVGQLVTLECSALTLGDRTP
jgi:hypothetical protein